jgi:hypothetical protein
MREGACHCRAVRYRLKAEPLIVHCCHCTDCQRHTGSAFAVNALIETANIELLSGEPVAISMGTESGRPHDIHRCPTCHVAVWSDYGRRPFLRFLRVATLDPPHAIPPDVHIYVRSKLPWVRLPEDARTFEAFYEIDKEWSPRSLERRKAMIGG